MQNLTYGRKKPEPTDSGFWDELAANIVLDDGHTHNGNDSAPLSGVSVAVDTIEVTGTGWTADGERYYKLVTLSSGYTFANSTFRFIYNGGTYDGEELFPTTDKQSSTTFRVYMPMDDQAIDVKVK